MKTLTLLTVSAFFLGVSAFGGSEDKFLKKYAMMKIYESCFGPEVVKQIRKEMRDACMKCAIEQTLPTPPEVQKPEVAPSFDVNKLQQTILAYRPNSPPPVGFYRPPYEYSQQSPFYNTPMNPMYANPMFYPGFNPQANQYQQYGSFPIFGQNFYGNRVSRDMNLKAQLEALTSKMSGKVRNITCVMQELGYLNENLEPNYPKIMERIENLPIGEELKKDMQDGVTFCQQFSQCVPDVKKDRSPLSRELIRPMFFFKCYKHKKLEACIMKDVREKYAGVADDDFDSDVELRRTGKAMEKSSEEGVEELTSSMYDFLYGSESNMNIDSIL